MADTYPGFTVIGPSGEYLAGPMVAGEGVVTADISLERALPFKQKHNVLGHYARWDVLSLNFNREKLSPLKNMQPAGYDFEKVSAEQRKIREKLNEIDQKLEKLSEK